MSNEKYKLIGFSNRPKSVVNIMVLASGKHVSYPLDDILNTEVADDLSPREVKEICRKLYAPSGFKGAYDLKERKESYWITFAVIITILSAVFTLSNITGVKPIHVGDGFIVPFAIFLYPVSFILVDILNEFYGLRYARMAIVISALINALLLVILNFSSYAPTIDGWGAMNKSYETIVHSINSVFMASMLSYFISENVNAYLLHKIKQLTQSKWLFIRVFCSTFFASLIDSALFIFIAFSGVLDHEILVTMFVCQVIVKTLYAVFGIGPIYAARALFNRYILGGAEAPTSSTKLNLQQS